MTNARNPELSELLALCRLDRTFVRAEGVWLTDADGRKFLDAYAQFGAVALGHNAPAVNAAALQALGTAAPVMCQPYPAAQAEALAQALFARAPGGMRRCVFTTSGAETVEAAIKLVRARSGRELVLAADNAFHGKSLGTLSLMGRARHAEGFGPLAPGFGRVPFGDAAALEARFAQDGDRIAALVLEPIQGEGGVRVPPSGYLARARALCTRHGAALVLDEIQTGLGRTGALFACQHEGVAPDVLVLSKALGGGLFPLGACLSSEAWWSERFAFGHSSTFASNNVACAVGLAVLRELDGWLCAHAAARGRRLFAGLNRLAARYPRVIAGVRGRGLLAALELVPPDDQGSLMLGYLQQQGLYAHAAAATLAETTSLLVLPTLGTDNILRIAPPLVITDEQIDLLVDGLESFCAQLQRNPVDTIARGLGWLAPAPRVSRPIALPAVPARPSRRRCRRWAFILHFTRPEDLATTDPGLRRLSSDERAALLERLTALPAGICLDAPPLRSATGAEVDGLILAVPMLPQAMLRRGRRLMSSVIGQGVELAARHGADVVGLGGFTAPLTDRGMAVVGRGPRITTGNALTAGLSFRAVTQEAHRRGLALRDATVGVLGARGSVGALVARLFARCRPRKLVLIGSPLGDVGLLRALADELGRSGVDVVAGHEAARLRDCQIVVTATGAARGVLDETGVAAGTLVCDVARPADTSAALRARTDVTVLEGGLAALPDPAASFGPGNLQGLPSGVQLACLSETILHALAGTTRDFGVGHDVPLDDVDQVLALADRHGFRAAWRVDGKIHMSPAADTDRGEVVAGGPR